MRLLTEWNEKDKVQIELDPVEFIKYLRWQQRFRRVKALRKKVEDKAYSRFGHFYSYTAKPNGKYHIRINK
jgi:type II secretory pathway component PulM